ncbi:hypothetical protein JQC91_00975 [Jannaschia sp. Os4]|uniref:hypothetical protein n=1 Tax=Jannaschia sp. Os4 TaxID=2807617 RepID=UPI0019397719|nr:hypothetical protein [Jannaschia sp. Os4]MBM2574864.1 hypothetical protein [Jannaschia sp. Os4]
MAGRDYSFEIGADAADALARAAVARRGGWVVGLGAAACAGTAVAAAALRPDWPWAPVAALALGVLLLAWFEAARARARRRGPLVSGPVKARIGRQGVDWRAGAARLQAGWTTFGAPRSTKGDLLLWRGPEDVLPIPAAALADPARAAEKVRAWIARREGGASLDLSFDLPKRGRARWTRAAARPEGRRAILPDLLFALAVLWPVAVSAWPDFPGWAVPLRLAVIGLPMGLLLALSGWAGHRARALARMRAPGLPHRWRVSLRPEGMRAEAPDLVIEAPWTKGMRAVPTSLGVAILLDGARMVPLPAAVLGDLSPREVARVVNRWIRRGP